MLRRSAAQGRSTPRAAALGPSRARCWSTSISRRRQQTPSAAPRPPTAAHSPQTMGFPPYNKELADLSWQRLTAFFAKHLA